jgi:hypothetical protein
MTDHAAAIGRTRTGDQLHVCGVWVQANGDLTGGYNAHCNNHSHLRLLSAFRSTEKVVVKLRPGLLCRKCFGTSEPHILAREFINATVVA